MNITLSFSEFTDIVKKKLGHNIELGFVDNSTVKVTFRASINMLIKTISQKVSSDVRIEKIIGSDLYLHYSINMLGGNFIANQIEPFLSRMFPSEIVDLNPNNEVVIHLYKINNLMAVFDKITIQDVSFDEENVIITFTLK